MHVHEIEQLRARNAWLVGECHRLTLINATLADTVALLRSSLAGHPEYLPTAGVVASGQDHAPESDR